MYTSINYKTKSWIKRHPFWAAWFTLLLACFVLEGLGFDAFEFTQFLGAAAALKLLFVPIRFPRLSKGDKQHEQDAGK